MAGQEPKAWHKDSLNPRFYLYRASLETQTLFAQNQPQFHIKRPKTFRGIHQNTLRNHLGRDGGGYNRYYFGTSSCSSDLK